VGLKGNSGDVGDGTRRVVAAVVVPAAERPVAGDAADTGARVKVRTGAASAEDEEDESVSVEEAVRKAG
jgi:hypothetical protein